MPYQRLIFGFHCLVAAFPLKIYYIGFHLIELDRRTRITIGQPSGKWLFLGIALHALHFGPYALSLQSVFIPPAIVGATYFIFKEILIPWVLWDCILPVIPCLGAGVPVLLAFYLPESYVLSCHNKYFMAAAYSGETSALQPISVSFYWYPFSYGTDLSCIIACLGHKVFMVWEQENGQNICAVILCI